MNDAERALRGEIIRTCKAMQAHGINQGTSGNVSVRWGDGLLITPSGLAYDTMAPEDIIMLHMDGTSEGTHAPSSEWRFHRDILRERPDLNAVVHAHPPYLTGLSILNKDIPAVHYMIAAVGGPTVRCAPYATYGTDELSRHALAALKDRTGCILANHGVIACGNSLAKALWLAVEMETLAQQYVIALQAGTPVVLPDDEIAHVMEKFKGYGPRRKDAGVDAPSEKPAPKKRAAPARAAPKTAKQAPKARAAASSATTPKTTTPKTTTPKTTTPKTTTPKTTTAKTAAPKANAAKSAAAKSGAAKSPRGKTSAARGKAK